jgi:hypothetical protein
MARPPEAGHETQSKLGIRLDLLLLLLHPRVWGRLDPDEELAERALDMPNLPGLSGVTPHVQYMLQRFQ